eukprot:269309_1
MKANNARIIDWNWLRTNYPLIYKQRKVIVDERIKQKLSELSTTITIDFENHPNSIIQSYLHHKGVKNSAKNVQNERQKLLSFMKNHQNEHTKNQTLQALHEMSQINIIVLVYVLEIDQITQQSAYYNSSFQELGTLVLLHRPHLNQYDHCRVEYAKSEYIAPCANGSIYNELNSATEVNLKLISHPKHARFSIENMNFF